jgi:hypothetical protein
MSKSLSLERRTTHDRSPPNVIYLTEQYELTLRLSLGCGRVSTAPFELCPLCALSFFVCVINTGIDIGGSHYKTTSATDSTVKVQE